MLRRSLYLVVLGLPTLFSCHSCDHTAAAVLGGFNGRVFALAIFNGDLYVAGDFTTYKGTKVGRLARIDSSGNLVTSLATGDGFDGAVNAVAIDSNGNIFAGGDFLSYQGQPAVRIAKIKPDGTLDTSFATGAGFNESIKAIAVDATTGHVIVGGAFTDYDGATRKRIVRLTSTGSDSETFFAGDPATGFNLDVHSLLLLPNGALWVGGAFTGYTGGAPEQLSDMIIRLDGTTGAVLNMFTNWFATTVLSLAAAQGGVGSDKIYAGGDFFLSGPTGRHLMRFTATLTQDATFATGAGFDTPVWAVGTSLDSSFYAGGDFTTYKGTTAPRIIRLDDVGTADPGFAAGTGFNGPVFALVVGDGGNVYVGGDFTSYNGTAANRIVRLEPNGSIDPGFNTSP